MKITQAICWVPISKTYQANLELFEQLALAVGRLSKARSGPQYSWLWYLSQGVTSVAQAAKAGGLIAADAKVMELFSPLKGRIRSQDEKGRLASFGAAGGRVRTRKKQMASRKNGLKGGRPTPDKCTLLVARLLLERLLRRNRHAWFDTANYRFQPRVLRTLVILMNENGISVVYLRLPSEWDPSTRSKDRHKPHADSARRLGYWPVGVAPRPVPF